MNYLRNSNLIFLCSFLIILELAPISGCLGCRGGAGEGGMVGTTWETWGVAAQ